MVYPSWRYSLNRRAFAEGYRQLGSLYGGLDADTAEARLIRRECEEHGVPMGYGRVGRAPVQLTAAEARGQQIRDALGRLQ